MKALTVRQPWAECIARGVKLVENRSRPVSHRGPLAIHAGLQVGSDYQVAHVRRALALGWGAAARAEMEAAVRRLDRGFVIAVADLVDCHPAADWCAPWGAESYNGKPAHHLVLADVRRLAVPFLAVGRLGLWDVDLHDPREAAT